MAEVDDALEAISALSGTGSAGRRAELVGELFARATDGGAGVPAGAGARQPAPGRAGLAAARRDREGRRRPGDGGAPGSHVHPCLRRGRRRGVHRRPRGARRASGWCRVGRSARCSPRRLPTSPSALAKVTGAQCWSTASSTGSGSRCTGSATTSASTPAASTTSPTGCPRSSQAARGPARRRRRAGRRGDRAAARTGGRAPSRRPRPGPRPPATSPVCVRRTPVTVQFFDLLHLDGRDLLDEPGTRTPGGAARPGPASLVVPRTGDRRRRGRGEAFFADARRRWTRGGRGQVAWRSAYAAGRRGAGWVKVKPRHTLDLVVLAVEWGSGRRRGLLSNIHLGARDTESRRLRPCSARRSRG